MTKPAISIVIPAYNSETSLPELIRQLYPVMESVSSLFEIILVDDASADHTWDTILDLSGSYPAIRGYSLMKNSGQTNATICGLSHARYDIIVTMDDDLQHPPDQIPVLLKALHNHPRMDCIYGVFDEKHHSFYRNIGSRMIHFINQKAYQLPSETRSSGFRVLRRQLVNEITRRKTVTPSISVLILGCTKNVMSIPVTHSPRFSGTSNYTLARQFRFAFDNICNATVFPLRFVSATGISLCILSVFMALYYFIRFLSGSIGIQGWTTIVLSLFFFSGIILLSLGIIGEYLVRVLREVNQTPPYLIREQTGLQTELPVITKDSSQQC